MYCGEHSFHYGEGTARDNCPDCTIATLQEKVAELEEGWEAFMTSTKRAEQKEKENAKLREALEKIAKMDYTRAAVNGMGRIAVKTAEQALKEVK